MKNLPRKLSNRELADLPTNWENPTVDTSRYYETCMQAWEINEQTYRFYKAQGQKVQVYQGRFYVGI